MKNTEIARLINDLGLERINHKSMDGEDITNLRTTSQGIEALAEKYNIAPITVRTNWIQRGFIPASTAMDIERDFDGEYSALKLAGKE
jgi:hypothetical protein